MAITITDGWARVTLLALWALVLAFVVGACVGCVFISYDDPALALHMFIYAVVAAGRLIVSLLALGLILLLSAAAA